MTHNYKKFLWSMLLLVGAYWFYKAFRWRYVNDNTFQFETAFNLDLKKIEIYWCDYMGDDLFFENGKIQHHFSLLPEYWAVHYADSLSNNVPIDYNGDQREDYDHLFRFFKARDTIFCEYKMNKKTKYIVPLLAENKIEN
jgi:hypothetical protein